MQKLNRRIMLRYMIIFACVAAGCYLIYFFCARSFLLGRTHYTVQRVWNILQDLNPSLIEDDSEEMTDLLEELAEQANFVICSEDFEVIYATVRQNYGKNLQTYVESEKDLFSLQPDVQDIQQASRERAEIKGIIDSPETYYVYVFKNTHVLRRNLEFSNQILLCGMVLLWLAAGAILYMTLAVRLKPLGSMSEEIEALASGNYTLRKDLSSKDDEWKQVKENMNLIAEKLSLDEATLNNYAYLSRNGGEPERQAAMQKQMISNITHQLKTPLAIISSQVELSQTETDPVRREYYYQSVMEEIDKMSALISGILQNGGKVKSYAEADLCQVCLSDILSELVPKYESWMKGKDIVFESQIEPEIHVLADSDQIEQAVHNFMMNARKHTRRGKIIRLTLRKEMDFCEIGVYNDGNGIKPADMDKIWTNGYQAGLGDDKAEAGLGLYIVSLIVREHNGTCGITNENAGVRFWIRLPLSHISITKTQYYQ